MPSGAFKRWLSFQSPAPNSFNPLILQIYPLLPVTPIPQLPEMFGLLSALDSGDLYSRKCGHDICSNAIILWCPQERPSVQKKKSLQSVHRSFSKSPSVWQQCDTKVAGRIQFHLLESANLRLCWQTGTRKGSKGIHLTGIFKVAPPGRRKGCLLAP